MKIGVIGANGFLGRNFCSKAAEKSNAIFAYSSSNGTGINPQTGLFEESFNLQENLDVLFYFAQSPYYNSLPEKAEHVTHVNVTSAVNAINQAVSRGTKKFIYLSSGNVYKPSFFALSEKSELNRNDGYALSKIQAEQALSDYIEKIDITLVRLFGLFGHDQANKLVPTLINKIKNNEAVEIERNSSNSEDEDGLKISLSYVDDVVNILINLIAIAGVNIVNVGGKYPINIRQLSQNIGSILNRDVEFVVSQTFRKGDLIADIRYMESILMPVFTPLDDALQMTINSKS